MAKFLFTILLCIAFQHSYGQDKPGFKKDIPVYSSGEKTIYYGLIRKDEKILHLDTLENGFDSLQIRIWYNYPKTTIGHQILSLKKTAAGWAAALYDAVQDTTTTINPKSGWGNFIPKLFEDEILTLPDMYDIPKLEDNWNDGDSYCIEISDRSHYRLYGYHIPEKFKNFKEVRKLFSSLKLIRKEFGIKLANEED